MSLAVQDFLHPWVLGNPVTPGVGPDVVSCSPVMLGILQHLGLELPLAVMGLGEEPLPKVYVEPWFRLEGTCVSDWASVPVSQEPGRSTHTGRFRAPGS